MWNLVENVKKKLELSLLCSMSLIICQSQWTILHEKCPYSELFWSVFSRSRTKYREILRISLYLVRIWQNTDQNNSQYGHFLSTVNVVDPVHIKEPKPKKTDVIANDRLRRLNATVTKLSMKLLDIYSDNENNTDSNYGLSDFASLNDTSDLYIY